MSRDRDHSPSSGGGTLARLIAPELVDKEAAGGPALRGGRCSACGALSFPRAAVCTECLSEAVVAHPLSRSGRLYSYSTVHQAPKEWRVPYVLGYVDLDDGIRVLTHIASEASRLGIDRKVRLATGIVGTDASGAPLETYTFVVEDGP